MPGKGALSFARFFVLLLSFSAICQGAFCISASPALRTCGDERLAHYCLLPLGFLLLAVGIFWNTFHEAAKHKGLGRLFRRSPGQPRVSTIDRPGFYPPPYADSTDPEKQDLPLPAAAALKGREAPALPPPPPYAESSTGITGEGGGQEKPPPYGL
ncbi:TM252 protein, partial [Nothocercus julius]|nr:TM252 protein [Nothocercus julius]